jgi:hypothetical protein
VFPCQPKRDDNEVGVLRVQRVSLLSKDRVVSRISLDLRQMLGGSAGAALEKELGSPSPPLRKQSCLTKFQRCCPVTLTPFHVPLFLCGQDQDLMALPPQIPKSPTEQVSPHFADKETEAQSR